MSDAIPDIIRHPVEFAFIEIFYSFNLVHLPKFTKFNQDSFSGIPIKNPLKAAKEVKQPIFF